MGNQVIGADHDRRWPKYRYTYHPSISNKNTVSNPSAPDDASTNFSASFARNPSLSDSSPQARSSRHLSPRDTRSPPPSFRLRSRSEERVVPDPSRNQHRRGSAKRDRQPSSVVTLEGWIMVLDCSTGIPLLYHPSHKLIVHPQQVLNLISRSEKEGKAIDFKDFSQIEQFAELPTNSISEAYRISLSKLFFEPVSIVAPLADVPVPLDSSLLLYASKDGRQILKSIALMRRTYFSITEDRCRYSALVQNPRQHRKRVEVDLLQKSIPGHQSLFDQEQKCIADCAETMKALINVRESDDFLRMRLYKELNEMLSSLKECSLAASFLTLSDENESFEEHPNAFVSIFGRFWNKLLYLKQSTAASKASVSIISLERNLQIHSILCLYHLTASMSPALLLMSHLFDIASEHPEIDPDLGVGFFEIFRKIMSGDVGLVDQLASRCDETLPIKSSDALFYFLKYLSAQCEQGTQRMKERKTSSEHPLPLAFDALALRLLTRVMQRLLTILQQRIELNDEVWLNKKTEKELEIHRKVSDILSIESFPIKVSVCKGLLKLLTKLLKSSESSLTALNLDDFSLCQEIDEARALLQVLGFYWNGSEFQNMGVFIEDIESAIVSLKSATSLVWIELLPDFARIFIFTMVLHTTFSTHRSIDQLKKIHPSLPQETESLLDQLMLILKCNLWEKPSALYKNIFNLLQHCVVSGLSFFLPQPFRRVSFISDLLMCVSPQSISSPSKLSFDYQLPLKVSVGLTSVIVTYLYSFERSDLLSRLAFGSHGDPWAEILGHVVTDEQNQGTLRRAVRILSDIQFSSKTFDRYKDDPFISPLFAQIMRTTALISAPIKMKTILQVLLALAVKNAVEIPWIEKEQSESLVLQSRSILFNTQRHLLARSSAQPLNPTDEDTTTHPLLEYAKILMEKCNSKLEEDRDALVNSFPVALLIQFLPGFVSALPWFSPMNATLKLFVDLCSKFLVAFEDIELDRSEENGEESSFELEYGEDIIEYLSDGSSFIGDLLKMNSFIASNMSIEQMDDHIKKKFGDLPDSFHQLYQSNKKAILKTILAARSKPDDLVKQISSCLPLVRLLNFKLFGLDSSDPTHLSKAELFSCIACGNVFISNTKLLDHIHNPSKSPNAKPCLALSKKRHFLKSFLIWTISKCSQRLLEANAETSYSETMKSQQWIHSELLRGGIRQQKTLGEYQILVEDFIHARGAPGMLNDVVLSLPQFKIFPHRRTVGSKVDKAMRSIIVALMYHLGTLSQLMFLSSLFVHDPLPTPESIKKTLQTSHTDLLEYWAIADRFVNIWIVEHQQGMKSICSNEQCYLTTTLKGDVYKCEKDHESKECEMIESTPYTAISQRIISKCEFLLSLHPAHELPSQSASLRRSSLALLSSKKNRPVNPVPKRSSVQLKLHNLRNSMFTELLSRQSQRSGLNSKDEYLTDIRESLVEFVKDPNVDIRALIDGLKASQSRSEVRRFALNSFSQLIKAHENFSCAGWIQADLVNGFKCWPIEHTANGHHFLSGICNAGTLLLKAVTEEFAILSEVMVGIQKKQSLSSCFSLQFWRLEFRQDDFSLLQNLELLETLQKMQLSGSLYSQLAKQILTGVALILFQSEPSTFLIPNISKRKKSSVIALHGISKKSIPSLNTHGNMLPVHRDFLLLIFEAISSENKEELLFSHTLDILLYITTLRSNLSRSPHPVTVSLLEHLCTSPEWVGFFLLNLQKCLLDENVHMSPRVVRKLIKVCSVWLPLMKPSALCETADFGALFQDVESFCMCLFVRLGFFYAHHLFWQPEDSSSGIRMVKVSSLVLLVRSLLYHRHWKEPLSQCASNILLNLPISRQILRSFHDSHEETPEEFSSHVLASFGLFLVLGDFVDIPQIGARVIALKTRQLEETMGTIVSFDCSHVHIISDNLSSLLVESGRIRIVPLTFQSLNFVDIPEDALKCFMEFLSSTLRGSRERRRSSICMSNSSNQKSLSFTILQSHAFKSMLNIAMCTSLSNIPEFLEPFIKHIVLSSKTPVPLHQSDPDTLEEQCNQLFDFIIWKRIHQRVDETYSNLLTKLQETFGLSVHINVLERAAFLFCEFEDPLRSAVSWIGAVNRRPLSLNLPKQEPKYIEIASHLSELGYSIELCQSALEWTNGNEYLAAHWLMDDKRRVCLEESQEYSKKTTEHVQVKVTNDWGKEGIDTFFECGDNDPLNTMGPLRDIDIHSRLALYPELLHHSTILKRCSKDHSPSSLALEDVRLGQVLRVFPKSSKNFRNSSAEWFLNTMSNSWETFDERLSIHLEEKWNEGELVTMLDVEDQMFVFRLDRMVMYQADTNIMFRIKRKQKNNSDIAISSASFPRFSSKRFYGIVEEIDPQALKVLLRMGTDDLGKEQSRWFPVQDLEFIDQWIFNDFPETGNRVSLGIDGLILDSWTSLAILNARKLSVSLLGYLEPTKIIQLLSVQDIIDLFKLVASDLTGTDSSVLWRVIQKFVEDAESSSEIMETLLCDLIQHLKNQSSSSFQFESNHPYKIPQKIRQTFEIPNANAMLIEFDARCALKDGSAFIKFFLDCKGTCSKVFSGSSVAFDASQMSSGFAPFIVSGSKCSFEFVSSISSALSSAFGVSFRARPLGYRFEDEKDLFDTPLGWKVADLLCNTNADVLVRALTSRKGIVLIDSMTRYLTCEDSPCKSFVANCLTTCLHRIKNMRKPFQVKLMNFMGGQDAFLKLQKLRDKLQGYLMTMSSGLNLPAHFKAIVTLLDAAASLYPSIRFRPTAFLSDGAEIFTNPFVIQEPFGKIPELDRFRVELCMNSVLCKRKLPSDLVIEIANENVNEFHLIRLCLKELETSIKIAQQVKDWRNNRSMWMTMIHSLQSITMLKDILIMLKNSMVPSAFKPSWNFKHQDWTLHVNEMTKISESASSLLELENAFRWDENGSESQSNALVTSWRSSRNNWIKTLESVASGNAIKAIEELPSSKDVLEFSWTLVRDEDLVKFVQHISSKHGRRLRSLTCSDIYIPSNDEISQICPSLQGIPLPQLRSRFAVLKLINRLMAGIIVPVADLSSGFEGSYGQQVLKLKRIIFLEVKMAILHQQNLYSTDKDTQIVILNRHEAASAQRERQTLFAQLYQQLRHVDPNLLSKKGQSWKVRFVGEGGHDVGGLYNASLSDICVELQSEHLSLFVPTANQFHGLGEHREKFVPNPSRTSLQHISWFEFVGRLIGLSCLSLHRTIDVDFPSLFWKKLTGDIVTLDDLREIDIASFNIIQLMRFPEKEHIDASNFESCFPDMNFVVDSCDGSIVGIELVENGSNVNVSYANREIFADCLESYRFSEFDYQIAAITRGISSIVPLDHLKLFSWEELEVVVCGSPDIDIALLKEKTVYLGNVGPCDSHILMFWECLDEFTDDDRKAFLQFVWGRSRLPSTKVGFGKDVFRISDHVSGLSDHSANSDLYLPVAHTCFFALELPRYSNKEVMKQKLSYAIHHCRSIDADTTVESEINMQMAWNDDDATDE